jgi:hypothetical protein
MPVDLLSEQNEPRDLLANVQQPEDNNELSFRQGIEPDYIDKVFSFFRDPQKEKARATLALVDSEALGINPHTAYNAKKGIDKYYDIDPTRKKAKEDKLQRIKAFNDMGGEEEEWHTLFLRNVQKLPYYMMDAAGNWIRMFEENPEAAFAMTGATPSEEDLQTFKLATEAIEKKKVRTLGEDIAGAAKEKIKSLTPATAPDSWKDTVHMSGDSVMTNLVWLIPGFKYGKVATLTGMGLQATGQTYGEQREGGSDPGTAFAAATIGGMSEVLSAFIPVGIYLKPKASLVRSLVAAELTEIPTEMANQVVQDVVDKVTIRPDMTIEDMIDNLTQTIQVTALSTLALSGMSYSANKAIGKSTQGTEHADSFNQAKNRALRDGKAPQEAIKEGIEAIKSTPEGQTFVDQKEAEIKQAAKDYKPTENKTPFIIGVNDENGEVTSFTMADPVSGQTFDVPAINKSGDKEGETVKFIPDPKVINEALSRIREPEEIDTKIDKIIEGNEDIDKVVNQIFGEDVPDFESEEDTTTPEKTEPAANVEPLITEARKYKTAEEFVKAQLAKNEKSGNMSAVTKDKGTGNITAKENPTPEAGKETKQWMSWKKDIMTGKRLPSDLWVHGSEEPTFKLGNAGNFGGSLFLTKDAEFALGYAKQNIDNVHGFKIKADANILDVSDLNKVEDFADALIKDKKFKNELMRDDLAESPSDYKEELIDSIYDQDIHEHTDFESPIFQSVAKKLGYDLILSNNGMVALNPKKALEKYQTFYLKESLPNPSRSPMGGEPSVKDLTSIWNKAQEGKGTKLNDVSSILNPVEIVNTLKGLTQNIKEAMPHLEALGRNIYESGKVKFNEWSASMKETLGDLWESFKDVMNQVYEFTKRKLSEERGSISNRDAVNADPMFEIAKYIKERGGLNYDSLIVDWGKEDVGILMKKRPGVVRKDGALKLDEVAQEWDTNDNDLMMDLLSNKSKKDVISKVSSKAEEEYLKEIYRNEQVSREEFTRAVNKARIAFKEGNAAELKKLRNSIKWMVKRKETLKNVRDYFGLTDTEMSKISRKNPLLMDEADFAQYLKDVNLKAIDLRDNKWAKIELMNLVEQKRLQKVDNYRRALELPSIDKMTTDQLRQFAKLLEPFQNDDIFLTQRELETVDKTDLKGIKTWREARERLAKEAGVPIEELAKVKVAWNENFKWDSSLREQDPFFDLLVTKMTESMMGAEMKVHNVESNIYDLAKKAEKSRKRGIVERMIPQDELIFQYLEAPQAEKNAVAQQMTPEQLRMAHFMNQYFSNALNYLIAIKTVEHGRQNYITHIRKSFMENMRDKGIKEAITGLFTAYQEDQIGFNILDDDTGNILPLEKFFQFSLHRTGELDPTKNVTRAFMTYVAMFEKKKAFDAIIPKLDIYTQSLTPVKYTPRGLEFDRSLKTFVNKWINNKKGRKISYDSAIRQGGVLDLGIRALRTITTMIDLGFYVPAQIINFGGEQLTTIVPLGYKDYAKSIGLMRTDKGQRILKKYEFFTERSLWEEFTAPGKEIQQRLMDGMFGLFHISSVAANKQFLLASMTKEEWANEELAPDRLAQIKLDMGRFRAIPGDNSLVGSTSIGGSAMQYKAWAVSPTRTLIKDITTMAGKLKKKQYGEAFASDEARELYRIVGTTIAIVAVTSMAGDDDDDSFIGKMKKRAVREVFTLTQGMDPTFWLSWRSLSYLAQLGTALKNLLFLEEYETKEGLKGVNQLKKAVTPGMIRALPDEEE